MSYETDCDMVNTDLCAYYRGRYACMYGRSHGVKYCPYGKLDYYKEGEVKKSG